MTHTIELDLSGKGRVPWPVCFAAIHDWCVESIFDRIEVALRTGEMPALTRRKMPWLAATSFALLRRRKSARPG